MAAWAGAWVGVGKSSSCCLEEALAAGEGLEQVERLLLKAEQVYAAVLAGGRACLRPIAQRATSSIAGFHAD